MAATTEYRVQLYDLLKTKRRMPVQKLDLLICET